MPSKIKRLVSGGQTGADRAALDFAIANKISYSGYVPKGRWAEDGPIAKKYKNLIETPSTDVTARTEMNVIHSDATLIISAGKLSGGSLTTWKFARKHKRPCLHIDLASLSLENAADKVRIWLQIGDIDVLNVAGPRASKDPQIYADTYALLSLIFLDK